MTSNVQPRSFNLELGREAIYNARLEINPPKILEKYLHNKNSKEQKELIGELALSLIGENENLENLKNVKAYLRVKAAKEVKANQDGIERLLNKLMNNTFKDNDQKSLKQKQGHESLESLSDQDRLDIPKGKFAELDMQALQDEKEKIIDKIKNTFLQSEKLQNYFSDQPNDFTNKLQQWCTEITNLKTTHEDELLAKNYVSRVLQALQAKNWDVLWNVNFKLLKNQLQILKGLFSLEQEVNSDIQAEIEQLADALAEIKDEIKQCRREIFEIDLEIRTKIKLKMSLKSRLKNY
ncbi:MAG: hypothetical protein HWD61_14465 [Parachlamydiaceae bacterium]|nr:MAG: hypothetical protein HWD61_14465 [Parachlamydiaceae bacterium]